ncbi:uncharacterized protein LOC106776158 isoform X2 [Vigna radiata var. radiata]|uniref:Uncharacterized protein LOC106776158 isoform X2 n=1 Tax=Vigna radiata var. radiata TaxID=3916 RepID=A0A3Q0FF05_VIGRR|nr:uncharacterized protein LOC106776158 isoform X2 [Vigna radiata var. radiata]
MDSHWSSRQTFERYVYDYLVKRNMRHTAEVFSNETNLHLDAAAFSTDAVDVPEGFLLEWWSVNNDFEFFRQMHEKRGLLGGMQGRNAFQGVGSSINVQPMYQFPNNFNPVEALNIGSNLMPSRVTGEWPVFSSPSAHQKVTGEWPVFSSPSALQKVTGEWPVFSSPSAHQKVSGKLPQFLIPFSRQEAFGQLQQLSSSHQDVVMTPVEKTTQVSNVNSAGANSGFIEETDPLIENLLKSFWLFEPDEPSLFDKSTVGQSSRNAENLVERGVGNTSMNTIAGSSQALEDDNKSDTSDCSSSFEFVLSDADGSSDPQLESNGET